MKNKFFIIAPLIFVICILITGCGNNNKYKEPDIVATFGEGKLYHYHYIIDNKTGVVYLLYDFGDRTGITVMLNADGTPVLKNQIETERGKDNVE